MKFAKLAAAAVMALGTLAPMAARADVRHSLVPGISTDTYRVWFEQGTHAVVVRGDGDTDLDLYVHGASGLIAADEDNTDQCVVRFFVSRPGYFMVKIVNRGLLSNRYVLVTN